MGVLVKLISELNSALGVTCVVVSHDVPEVLSIADHALDPGGQKNCRSWQCPGVAGES
ncbi:ABC transporter ATP-binding protein [Escherichia coli]|nr:ABC transporter ATP-binding protein [Escherichia coli]